MSPETRQDIDPEEMEPEDVLETLRANPKAEDLEKILEYYKEKRELKDADDVKIDLPDRSDLLNQRVTINNLYEPVEVNGVPIHPVFCYIINSVVTGHSPTICIVGEEGNGKSMAALYLSHRFHDMNLCRGDFDPNVQTVYRPEDFQLTLEQSTREVIWFEEANETLNANDYHSKMNRSVARLMRTQRKRENLYIFSCPKFKRLDSRVRRQVDLMVNMVDKQVGKLTVYQDNHAKRSNRGLDYDFINFDKEVWEVPDVPEERQREYEQIDNRFKGEYLQEIIIESLEDKIEELKSRGHRSH